MSETYPWDVEVLPNCTGYHPFLFECKVTNILGATITTAEQGTKVRLCARISRGLDSNPCAHYDLTFYTDSVANTGLITTLSGDATAGFEGEWVYKEWTIPLTQTVGLFTYFGVRELVTGEEVDKAFTITEYIGPSYTLTVTISPTTGGQVSMNPNWTTYLEGTSVELTAQSALGYAFDYWTGGLTGTTNPKSLIMNGDKTVVAHFKSTAEVTCYGCNINEVKSQGYPIGTVCSETDTPEYPYAVYPDCSGNNWIRYLLYAGGGLVALGLVVYLVKKRRPPIYYPSSYPTQQPKTRNKTTAKKKK